MKAGDLDALLRAGAPVTETRSLRVLSRSGEPLLILPNKPFLAKQALSLYPAQTGKARAARAILAQWLRYSPWPAGAPATIEISASARLPSFIADLHGGTMPDFAALLGNPRAPGRRVMFLTFDKMGAPRFVVKAGATSEAIERVLAEANILDQLPTAVLGTPTMRQRLREDPVAALAFDFVPGRTPRRADDPHLPTLLEAWISKNDSINCGALPAWERLRQAPNLDPAARQALAFLESREVRPAIHHGDFAPWNVKIDGGRWIALDWERGELVGPPIWDWLHYVVQRAILVNRSGPERIVRELDEIFASTAFTRYADRARCTGLEWALAAAYLWHACEVVGQTEGLETVRALARLVTLTRL